MNTALTRSATGASALGTNEAKLSLLLCGSVLLCGSGALDR